MPPEPTAAIATSGLRGSITSAVMYFESARPAACHDLPASSERNTPAPRMLLPVPTYRMLGFDGATATKPMPVTGKLSEIDAQVRPPLVDFHSAPDGEPA